MKTEYVVIYFKNCLYGCNVADEKNQVVNLVNNIHYLDRIITCQIAEVINILFNKYGCISNFELLDFECLDRQIRQSVEYCENLQEDWSLHEMVLHYTGRELLLQPENYIEETLSLLTNCYREIKKRGTDEWTRIEQIEIPVNRVLYDLVARGIAFRQDKLEDLCRVQHKKLYHALNKIQLNFNQVQPDIETVCHQLNIPIQYIKYGRLKTLCKQYPDLQPFREAEKAERNLRLLAYLSAIRKNVPIVKPIVKPIGTRTSRIIMREPSLQNMSKDFRGLLYCPSNSFNQHRYLYVDYSQFEAGILAGLTKNRKLINLYEKNNIYTEIEKIVNCDRQEAKIHFYCFIYGGKRTTLLKDFFNYYCPESDLEGLITPKASSLLGNSRNFDINADRNKILNHIIQSTGSLIFKQALIDVYKCYHWSVELVLPLHDGALYKITDQNIKDDDIFRIYRDAFQKWIPNVSPIVKSQQFFPEE